MEGPSLLPAEGDVVIRILGTAQDGGIPQIGCDCPNCERARRNPAYARLIASLAILDLKEKRIFMVDATPDIRRQFESARERLYRGTPRPKAPDGILITHAHIGHYAGLMFFGYESQAAHRLPVYGSHRMRAFLSANGPWSQLVHQQNILPVPVEAEKSLSLTPNASIIPFPVPHRDEYSDTLGFTIVGPRKRLLYIPDIRKWTAWTKSAAAEVEKVDAALLDGTFFGPEELPGRELAGIGHPFIRESLDALGDVARSGKTRILFTHFNHSNPVLDPDGAARRQIEKAGFGLAEDNLEIVL